MLATCSPRHRMAFDSRSECRLGGELVTEDGGAEGGVYGVWMGACMERGWGCACLVRKAGEQVAVVRHVVHEQQRWRELELVTVMEGGLQACHLHERAHSTSSEGPLLKGHPSDQRKLARCLATSLRKSKKRRGQRGLRWRTAIGRPCRSAPWCQIQRLWCQQPRLRVLGPGRAGGRARRRCSL
jgi:hypothetical protein